MSLGLLRLTKLIHSIFLPHRAKSLLSERFVWVFPRESPYWFLAMKALLRGKITKVQWLLIIENSHVSVLDWIRAICHFLFPVRRDLERTCSLVTHTLTRSMHVCMSDHTGSPNAVSDNRKIRCIYTVLANKIIICIYLCSCVFMRRFGRDLNTIRDG